MLRKAIKAGGWALAVALVVVQFFQPARTNPPADRSASIESSAHVPKAAAAVAARACGDCHSHGTTWPWYSKIAPVSWLVAGDVNEGRAKLNFSEWNQLSPEMSRIRLGAACDELRSGEMPPWYYVALHPAAKVSARDVAAFCGAPGS